MSDASHHDRHSMAGTTTIVFGGRGFIGSHLVDYLVEQGGLVRSFDRPPALEEQPSRASGANPLRLDGDFTSGRDVGEAMVGCDYCFHLVSTTLPKNSNADPVYDIETNLVSSIRLLDHAVRLGIKKVIFISSGGTVYGVPRAIPIPESHPTDPICSYGIGKLAIEKYLALYRHLYGLNSCTLRLSNPYGERQRAESSQGVVAVFVAKALRGESIQIWGDGSIIRDYVYISDVVGAIASAAVRDCSAVMNIGSGSGMSLNQMLDSIELLLGAPIQRTYSDPRPFDVPSNVLDISLAERLLGWSPSVDFETGLRRVIEARRHETGSA